jgi:DNA-binding SARP family transcriptional activator/tetratricopeptide (TPR) repeat protein
LSSVSAKVSDAPDAAPGLLVDILGPVQVRELAADGGAGAIVDLGRPLHLRVLACLVAAEGPVEFDSLIDRVWGELGTSSANLHAVMSRLRGRLGEGVITTERSSYRLDTALVRVDATEFTRELAEARASTDPTRTRSLLERGLARWRGTAYADVPLAFAEQEAMRLGELRLLAHEMLAELDLERGQHLDVAARLLPLVAQNPLRESLRASLMLACYRAGRQADALAVYDEGRAAMADELGIDPGPALRRLHDQVLRQDDDLLQVRAAVTPTSTGATGGTPVVGLVGRREPLARLRELVDRGRGPAAVAIVSGEAGIGKTTLVEAAFGGLRGAVLTWGRCWDHEGVPPLWPWEQALTALADQIGQLDPEGVAQALTGRGAPAALLIRTPAAPRDAELHSRGEAGGGEQGVLVARTRLYEGVVAFLARLANTRPVVLVLEDVHWADDETIALAEYVAASLTDVRLTVVVTFRDPAGGGVVEGSSDPAVDVEAALTRARHVTRIQLGGLNAAEVRELVERHTTVPVTDQVAAQLLSRTEGNPFFIEELARLVVDERHASGRADTPVPPSVRAVIERRLRHLAIDDQDLLRTAALVGRAIDLNLLARALDLQRWDAVAILDRAARAGLLVEDATTGEQRFSHALVQEVLAASLGRHRRAVTHARLADALEERQIDDPAHIARLAFHHLAAGAAGDPVRAVGHAMHAARLAEERLALGEAERLVGEAIEMLTLVPAPEGGRLELDARLLRAGLLTQRVGYSAPAVAQAWRECLRAAEDAGSVGHVLAALWGTWHNAITSSYAGDHTAALAAVAIIEDAATRGDGGDPNDPDAPDAPKNGSHAAARLLLHLARGQTAWHRGRLEDAHADLARAVEISEDIDDVDLLATFPQHPGAQARAWLAVTSAQTRSAAESDAIAAATVQQSRRLGHAFTTVYSDIVLALRAMWLERPGECREHAERAIEAAGEHGLAQLQVFALIPAGWSDILLGSPSTGADRLELLVALAEDIDGNLPFASWLILALLATGRATAGDHDAARTWVDRAYEAATRQHSQRHLLLVDELKDALRTGVPQPEWLKAHAVRLGTTMMVMLVDA